MNRTKKKLRFIAVTLFAVGALYAETSAGDSQADMQAKLEALSELADKTPAQYPAEGIASSNGCTPLFYEGLPYQGKPTRVFAWYARPQGDGPFPAVVLVHGGGGTAFAEWAAKWRDHGFCAIAMDMEGHLPIRENLSESEIKTTGQKRKTWKWKKHEWAGPEVNGIYGDIKEPIENQWPYHAAADVLLAKALLKSFPEVDTNKIGITGFSWGGIHTATVIGIDTNWLFAIPIYHSGALSMIDHHRRLLGSNVDLYKNTYDSLGRLSRVQFPTMWLTGLHDPTFPLDAQRACYRAARGPCLISVQTEMKHGSFHAWNPEDSYVFAKSVVETGKPWITVTGQGVRENVAYAEYNSSKPIDRGELLYTKDTGFTGKRDWITVPVKPEGKTGSVKVSAALPDGTTAWYFNVYSGALAVSSEYTETDMPQK